MVRINTQQKFPPEFIKQRCVAVRITAIVQAVSKQTGRKISSKTVVSQLRALAGNARCQLGKAWFGSGSRSENNCASSYFIKTELFPSSLLEKIYRGGLGCHQKQNFMLLLMDIQDIEICSFCISVLLLISVFGAKMDETVSDLPDEVKKNFPSNQLDILLPYNPASFIIIYDITISFPVGSLGRPLSALCVHYRNYQK